MWALPSSPTSRSSVMPGAAHSWSKGKRASMPRLRIVVWPFISHFSLMAVLVPAVEAVEGGQCSTNGDQCSNLTVDKKRYQLTKH